MANRAKHENASDWSGIVKEVGTKHENLQFEGVLNTNEDIEITQSAKLKGTISCASLKADQLAVVGALNAETLEARIITLDGTVSVSSLDAKDATITGTVIVDSLKASSLAGEGIFKGSVLDVRNSLCVTGTINFSDIKADTIKSKGKVTAKAVNARSFSLKLEGKEQSKIDQLQADTIAISSKSKQALLICKSITGSTVEVEHVIADRITGEIVTIGPNCEVNTVEFKDAISIHKTATVRTQNKL